LIRGWCASPRTAAFGRANVSRSCPRTSIGSAGGFRVEATLNLRNQRRESPKGGRRRWVKMPTIVADSLAAHLQAHPATEYVFHRADRRAWKASRVWEAWNDARMRCNLAVVDFHHLRHHVASLMVAGRLVSSTDGAGARASKSAMTLRIYAHLWPSEGEQGRTQLDAAIARLARPPADHANHVGGVYPHG